MPEVWQYGGVLYLHEFRQKENAAEKEVTVTRNNQEGGAGKHIPRRKRWKKQITIVLYVNSTRVYEDTIKNLLSECFVRETYQRCSDTMKR